MYYLGIGGINEIKLKKIKCANVPVAIFFPTKDWVREKLQEVFLIFQIRAMKWIYDVSFISVISCW